MPEKLCREKLFSSDQIPLLGCRFSWVRDGNTLRQYYIMTHKQREFWVFFYFVCDEYNKKKQNQQNNKSARFKYEKRKYNIFELCRSKAANNEKPQYVCVWKNGANCVVWSLKIAISLCLLEWQFINYATKTFHSQINFLANFLSQKNPVKNVFTIPVRKVKSSKSVVKSF